MAIIIFNSKNYQYSNNCILLDAKKQNDYIFCSQQKNGHCIVLAGHQFHGHRFMPSKNGHYIVCSIKMAIMPSKQQNGHYMLLVAKS